MHIDLTDADASRGLVNGTLTARARDGIAIRETDGDLRIAAAETAAGALRLSADGSILATDPSVTLKGRDVRLVSDSGRIGSAASPLRIDTDAVMGVLSAQALDDTGAGLRGWMMGQAISSLLVAALTWIGLWLLGVSLLDVAPYMYDALEPHIDAKTMEIHHTKHHQTYINNANAALEGTQWADTSAEDLIADLDALPEDKRGPLRNNAGGHANHSLFWTVMSPKGGGNPVGDVAKHIDSDLGGYDKFKADFQAKFGAEVQIYAPYVYDSVQLLVAAMVRA